MAQGDCGGSKRTQVGGVEGVATELIWTALDEMLGRIGREDLSQLLCVSGFRRC